MQLFHWNSQLETGIGSVDQQHRQLLQLINQLGMTLNTIGHIPNPDQLLQQLRDYTEYHFAEEESLFHEIGLCEADIDLHLKQHLMFCDKIAALHPDTMSDVEAVQKLHQFLVTWLVAHIFSEDMKLSPHHQTRCIPLDNNGLNHELIVTPMEQALIWALNESERRFRFLTDQAPMMIWATDALGDRCYFNQAWHTELGYSLEQAEEEWPEWVHPDDWDYYHRTLQNLLAERQSGDIEVRYLQSDGQPRIMLEKIMPRTQEDGVFIGLIAAVMDITEIKQAARLQEQANRLLEIEVDKRTAEINQLMLTDPLTQVGNRRYLDQHLEVELSRVQQNGEPLALIFFDIDHFKQINDTHGHNAGDLVLAEFAGRLRDGLRQTDKLARFGGEEFVAILPRSRDTNAADVALRILQQCRQQPLTDVGKVITFSAGVTEASGDDDMDSLLRRCDNALYRAKQAGRNQILIASQGAIHNPEHSACRENRSCQQD